MNLERNNKKVFELFIFLVTIAFILTIISDKIIGLPLFGITNGTVFFIHNIIHASIICCFFAVGTGYSIFKE